jgi:putative tryptophan/tyrosine transport system substrate-binding protein
MKRREFIAGLGSAISVMPATLRAQEAKIPIIGWLRGTTAAGSEHIVAGFRQGLSETGYFEGRNVVIDYRWADNHLDRQFALAADLVRRHVDVIATVGTISAALAAKGCDFNNTDCLRHWGGSGSSWSCDQLEPADGQPYRRKRFSDRC